MQLNHHISPNWNHHLVTGNSLRAFLRPFLTLTQLADHDQTSNLDRKAAEITHLAVDDTINDGEFACQESIEIDSLTPGFHMLR